MLEFMVTQRLYLRNILFLGLYTELEYFPTYFFFHSIGERFGDESSGL